jgi:hypothetical protein
MAWVGPVEPTTAFGNGFATALFWRPQAALVVNEGVLLAVFMAVAPATTLDGCFPDERPGVPRLKLGEVLRFGELAGLRR